MIFHNESNMGKLQFRRIFDYKGSMDKALENIKTKLSPALADGEPLVCSYVEDSETKYFLAVGMGSGNVKVFQSFSDQADFIAFIRKYAGNDLENSISDESDFTIEVNSEGKYILKVKEDLLGTTEADKLLTTADITVTGVTVGNLANGVKIPAGTDIMSLLTQMLAKELGVTATKPSAKLAGDTTKTVEKGTVISGKTFTTTYTDGKYTGVSGYSYTLSAGCEHNDITWKGVSGTESVSGNVYSIKANDIVVTSTVTILATVSYDGAKNIPVTNFGNNITTGLIGSGSVDTGSIVYTPQLKWWVGSSESKFEDMTWNSTSIRALSLFNNYVTTTSANVTFPKGCKQQVIAIPVTKSFTAKDGAGSDITGTFNLTAEVTVTCGGTHTEKYKIYVAPANAGLGADSKATITLV